MKECREESKWREERDGDKREESKMIEEGWRRLRNRRERRDGDIK